MKLEEVDSIGQVPSAQIALLKHGCSLFILITATTFMIKVLALMGGLLDLFVLQIR